MLPDALSIGMTYKEFMHSTPKMIKAFYKAYDQRLKRIDKFVWKWVGTYGISALSVVADTKGKAKYVKKTVLEMAEDEEYRKKQDRKEYKGMTKEQKQEAEWDMAKSYFDSLAARFPKEKDKTD